MIIQEYINKILHADCMDIMKDMPDKCIDLAIVDPPYGIGKFTCENHTDDKGNRLKNNKSYADKYEWNDSIPEIKYFNELKRISKYRIIWGANYYNCFENGGGLVWYKGDTTKTISHCELASLSFQKKVDYVHINWQSGFFRKIREGEQIHPCQKPVALYRWILQNYAKPGQLILDTHSGSGSLACACHLERYAFIAIEKDIDYWKDSTARLKELRDQGRLF